MTSNIIKFELVLNKSGGLWKYGARRFLSGLIINSRDCAPLIGDFRPLEELNDLGNMLKSLTRHNGMVSLGFMDKLKYKNIEEDMNDIDCCV
jgi:hypothetical protein